MNIMQVKQASPHTKPAPTSQHASYHITTQASSYGPICIITFAHGFKVYLLNQAQAKAAHVTWLVNRGARHDPQGLSGLAHQVEHQATKGDHLFGTLNYGKEKQWLNRAERTHEPARADEYLQTAARYARPNEYEHFLQALGASDIEAETDHDRTRFTFNIPNEALQERLLFKMLARTILGNNEVRRLYTPELQAIAHEAQAQLCNEDNHTLIALDQALHGRDPYGGMVTGDASFRQNTSPKAVRQFYETHYQSKNMALLITGQFDEAQLMQTLTKYFGRSHKKTTTSTDDKPTISHQQSARDHSVIHIATDGPPQVYFNFKAPPFSNEHASVLASAAAEILAARLRQQSTLSKSDGAIDVHYEGFQHTGNLSVALTVKDNTALTLAPAILKARLIQALTAPISEEEVTQVIQTLRTQANQSHTDLNQVALALEEYALYNRIPGAIYQDKLPTLLTQQSLTAFFKQTIDFDQASYATLIRQHTETGQCSRIEMPVHTPILLKQPNLPSPLARVYHRHLHAQKDHSTSNGTRNAYVSNNFNTSSNKQVATSTATTPQVFDLKDIRNQSIKEQHPSLFKWIVQARSQENNSSPSKNFTLYFNQHQVTQAAQVFMSAFVPMPVSTQQTQHSQPQAEAKRALLHAHLNGPGGVLWTHLRELSGISASINGGVRITHTSTPAYYIDAHIITSVQQSTIAVKQLRAIFAQLSMSEFTFKRLKHQLRHNPSYQEALRTLSYKDMRAFIRACRQEIVVLVSGSSAVRQTLKKDPAITAALKDVDDLFKAD